MSDLEWITTDELVDEIESRFDFGVFAFVRKKEEELDHRFCHWHGGLFACLGLAEDLSDEIRDRIRKSREVIE